MVRVISVHHFLKQEINSVDEIIDVAAVPPDILLLVQSNHTISVKNLSIVNDPGYTIPTVDDILKIIYSIQGNYIGTLEGKVTRNGSEVSYVRIYTNWEKFKSLNEGPPMRARIAGRVTPLSQNHQGLEMIEIPLRTIPNNIACCPVSGNLIISSKNTLTIYKFVTSIHDISKINFIDFEPLSVELQLSFTPIRMQIIEDMIAVQNDEFLHVFKMKSVVPTINLSDKEFSIDDFEKLQNSQLSVQQRHKTINYEKLIRENKEMKYQHLIDNSELLKNGSASIETSHEFLQSELSKVDFLSFPLQHDFPTILCEKSQLEPRCSDIFRQNPFTLNHDLSVNVINTSNSDIWKSQYKIFNILQYHLTPLLIGSTSNREMQEKFTCLILKPYYGACDKPPSRKQDLSSDHYPKLKSIACFFGTQQEGYLHCFEYDGLEKEEALSSRTYVVYPFTAPVIDVQLENSFVHTLTDSGLETYTMRAAQHLMKQNETETCPSSEDPICLVGLRPFVKVQKMCITGDFLTLFANNEESSFGMWTLYELKLPDPVSVWADFLSVAEENKWEAPATYSHLVGEGHLILKTFLKTIKWSVRKNKNQLQLAVPTYDEERSAKAKELYEESCALLADFHILYGSYNVASKYYTMSGLEIFDIMKRIQGLYEKIPIKFREKFSGKDINKGLIVHLKKTLAEFDDKYSSFNGNREEFYNPKIGNLVTILMDLLEKEEKTTVSDLVLGSIVLREFSTDRILKMMKNLLSRSSVPQDKDALSLALMCIQRGQNDQAKTVLLTMTAPQLQALLLQYSDLLFEKPNSSHTGGFSELSIVLIEIYPKILGDVLSLLVTEKKLMNLSKILKIFLDVLPSGGIQSRNSSLVLQTVLENYFRFYNEKFNPKKYDHKTTEALKILIRIYLSHLQQMSNFGSPTESTDISDYSDVLFYKYRPNYLDCMPPFDSDLFQLLSPPHGSLAKNTIDKDQKLILMKLQSLLSYEYLPEECLIEVRNFLPKQSYICGSLSLQAVCASSAGEVVHLLLNFAPQALVEFAKERLKEKSDWKSTVTQLENKINNVDDSRRKFCYQQMLTEILHYTAENLPIEDLIDVLPKDHEDSEKFLSIAHNNAQANHIRTLIMVTGKQLLASL